MCKLAICLPAICAAVIRLTSCAAVVGNISRRSRPYGFNTVIINLSCQSFGLDSTEVAERVPLPRRAVQATKPATTKMAAPSPGTSNGGDGTRFSNPLGGAPPEDLEQE
eukprot:COSAG02_NODE_2539_length_8577_cov_5.213730_5_plen_109_part_00